MIHFANISAFYLLLVVPVIAALFIICNMFVRKRLKKFGHPKFIVNLMPGLSKYMPSIKIVVALIASIFLIAALARPYTDLVQPEASVEENTSGIEIMICFDVSNSMLASSTDEPEGISRIQRAKFILEKLLNKLKNDKVGLIVFAGDAYTQLPVTSDFLSAKMFLNNLSVDAVPTQGTAIGAALEMAINSFSPDSDFKKAIILITDAENFEDDALGVAKQAASAGIQIDVIGVGGDAPMPIPVAEGSREYIVDQNGDAALTKVDEQLGQHIAKAGKGEYIDGNSSSAVDDIVGQLQTLSKKDYKRKLASKTTNELFSVALWLALILLLIDTLLPNSKIKWLSRYNFFSKNK